MRLTGRCNQQANEPHGSVQAALTAREFLLSQVYSYKFTHVTPFTLLTKAIDVNLHRVCQAPAALLSLSTPPNPPNTHAYTPARLSALSLLLLVPFRAWDWLL